tara:strand:- start:153 stop:905 length:753 start_codon:yes stop_codon:yes gene_type:complete
MGNLNFMVHCGGTEVARAKLAAFDVPRATRSYVPVPHQMLSDLIEEKLGDVGYSFGKQAHAVTREGRQYFGMAELVNGRSQESWGLVAGWRSSYDKSLVAGFVVGSQVFVCDNLAFSGEVQIGRKHTRHILRDLPYLIGDAVQGTQHMAEQQVVRYDRYRAAEMKDSAVNHAIIQMLRKDIITTQKVGQVVSEYYEPSHQEHLVNGKRTNWTLFNACTEALKGTGLNNLPTRTIKLHALMDNATEYALAA